MHTGNLGKYEIRGTLGRGAMGVVLDGWDPLIGRRVAIKVVRVPETVSAEGQEQLARFRREAQAAGRLHHANVVGVYDYGETVESAFIVMEFVEGRSLQAALDTQQRFTLPALLRIMRDVLAGLQFSHDRGVVHRDIKPANIMLTNDGQAKIADFGIARIESSSLTQAGSVIGTPAYMSPEQFMGHPVDARTDIYAAGILLYQLLTGERPFVGSLTSVMHKVLNIVPPKPSDLSVSVPTALDTVVARAIAKRPDDRFASASEFASALAHVTAASVEPASDKTLIAVSASIHRDALRSVATEATATRSSVARHFGRIPAVTAVAGFCVLAAGAAWTAFGGWHSHFAGGFGTSDTTLASSSPPHVEAAKAGMDGERPQTGAPQPRSSDPAAPTSLASATVPTPLARPAPVSVPPLAAGRESPPPVLPVAPASGPNSTMSTSTSAAASVPQQLPTVPQVSKVVAVMTSAVWHRILNEAIAAAPCSLVRDISAPERDMPVLTGLIGRGAPEATLHRLLAEDVSTIRPDWRLDGFDGPYCDVLDVIRPIAFRSPADDNLGLHLKDGQTHLQKDDFLIVQFVMPNFPAHLRVDYFQHDGKVWHMYPGSAPSPESYLPGSTQTIGEPTSRFPGWQVDAPYGADLIIATASSNPLFVTPRPDSEPQERYLPALKAALAEADERHDRLAVGALLLVTSDRR